MSFRFFLQSVWPTQDPWTDLRTKGDCPDFERTEALDWVGEHGLRRLWLVSAACPEYPSLLRSLQLHTLDRLHRHLIVEMILPEFWDNDEHKCKMLQVWRAHGGSLRRWLMEIPWPYRRRYSQGIVSSLRLWSRAEGFSNLPRVQTFWKNLCRSPMSSESQSGFAFELLSTHPLFPDKTYLAIEKAGRIWSAADRLSDGLKMLLKFQPALALRCLEHSPKPFLRVMKLLGGLLKVQQQRVLSALAGHPLLLSNAVTPELVLLHCPRTAAHRLPLDPRRVDLCRLDILTDSVLAAYQDFELEGDADTVLHAHRITQGMEENRKPLRRFLRATARGDRTYLARQPANRKWLRGQPKLPASLWSKGLELRDEASGCVLAIEQDPLEVLKMGTLVDSCLGVGEHFAYSVAAVVLDANKQVVYARDRTGRFVARQQLAIAKSGRLVCFYVYPIEISSVVKHAFLDYDRSFAAALGLELETEWNYEIENLVASHFWDDRVWNFKL